ncbi:CapA family protein [Paenibacillus protaetiae]|uniref:CapA family protein n=1 Tax=Paenibacillus protaetiae TaxID=2509456 RepID=A0A4P6ET31_9BACL|nr:CapA family protein [Paenibacillus protaetiae]QAY66094.1 CapA family protein [Paenibacillus protaetiae]
MRQRRKRRKHRVLNLWLLVFSLAGLVFIGWSAGWDRIFTEPAALNGSHHSSPPAAGSPQASSDSAQTAGSSPSGLPGSSASPNPASPVPTPRSEPEYRTAVWMAVGDVMMHTPELPGAYDRKQKRYNFDPYFEQVKPILGQGDWVLANLETPVAGKQYGYNGYPNFNAPDELLEALQHSGFNVLTFANNHMLDQGEQGLLNTVEQIKHYGFATKGAAASQEESDQAVIVEQNGIKMGLLAYTYGTNGHQITSGRSYLASYINEAKMKQDIQTIRKAGADFVVVALHFGVEYETEPNEEQKRLARSLIAEGADIVAGSHSHVLQPYEVVQTATEDGKPREGLILYSMGNFLSNQRGDTKDYGAIFRLTVKQNREDGSIQLDDIEAIPTWVYRYREGDFFQYRILPVEQTLAQEASKQLTDQEYAAMQKTYDALQTRLHEWQ